MNAVEIEEFVSELVAKPFDEDEFPFEFLTAFNAKPTTLKRLRKGDTNGSDVPGGVLWGKNIHLAVAPVGQAGEVLSALRHSGKTASQKAKFILATDGQTVEAEDLISGDVIACSYSELPRHFATFLPLAGISAVKEIKHNPVDVKATGRLNRLYVQLLKDNPGWETPERRPQLNQFMAQLIFCFFAEDTDIFQGSYKFSPTVERMTSGQSDNTQTVIAELFRAMGTPPKDRRAGNFPTWADGFPYVNGGYLFAQAAECPWFSRAARAYLLRAGELDWKEINPDIFGSMIQAVADDEERGELGMHYTSVPNILKVLNPLFLDGLREQLEAAGDSRQKLRNLRKRLASIRAFDPACGSGNFLVIAYKEMRAIEAEIVKRLGGDANLKLQDRRSVIPLSNFYGIEIKGFAAEIARLALLIAEFQADCLYLSQQEARAMVLPLHRTGQITVGNALRLDWLEVCPLPRQTGAELDLGGPTGRLALEENELNDGAVVETYICGNPPYAGLSSQEDDQKEDLAFVFSGVSPYFKSFDYVTGWLYKARNYSLLASAEFAFVMTNSICQGQQVPMVWPLVLNDGFFIRFAHTSFKWSNLASRKAAVTVVIVGLSNNPNVAARSLFSEEPGGLRRQDASNINAYLVPFPNIFISPLTIPMDQRAPMYWGCKPVDGGNLILSREERQDLVEKRPEAELFLKPYFGSTEFIESKPRFCIWVRDDQLELANAIPELEARFERVRLLRAESKAPETRPAAKFPHRFRQIQGTPGSATIVVPIHSSEAREWLPVGMLPAGSIVSNAAFAVYSSSLDTMAILASRLHAIWIATVCGKIKTDFRYSNTLGWNTFPLPKVTSENKTELTRCAETILLAREAHFPATIADLYDPENMPDDLRRAHNENDEVLERIYIGRRFRNDTERLEKLFDLYTKMTADAAAKGKPAKKDRQAA